MFEAANRNGVKRFIHMSALGAKIDSDSAYARTKALAEADLRASGLAFTIFRPSMILGPGGEFTKMLEGWCKGTAMPYYFMPYFGTGIFGLRPKNIQPIDVRDVAACFVKSLEMPETIGQSYDLGGPAAMTWPQLYYAAGRHYIGRAKVPVGLPIWYATLLTKLAPARWLPFNKAQLVMAGEDNVCDPTILPGIFGIMPRGVQEALRG